MTQANATATLKHLGLDKLGINSAAELVYNPTYEQLFADETNPATPSQERGTITKSGAVAVDTGRFTGRSPKDKYVVVDPENKEHVWWAGTGSDNHPMPQPTWDSLKSIVTQRLNGKKLYVI